MNSKSLDKFGARIGVVLEKHITGDTQGSYILKHQMGNIIEGIQLSLPKDDVQQVEEFHKVFNHVINSKPIDLSIEANKEMMYRRLGYLREELKEMDEAIRNGDIVELADVFIDLRYFLNGGVLEAGIQEIHDELFSEVHRSNMSKVCDSRELAGETMVHWKGHHLTPCHIEEHEGHFIVKRDEDNKVLKSVLYSPPNLKKIIDNYAKDQNNERVEDKQTEEQGTV